MEIMRFNSQKERLDYLHDNFNEIIPKEVVIPKEKQPTKKPKYCG